MWVCMRVCACRMGSNHKILQFENSRVRIWFRVVCPDFLQVITTLLQTTELLKVILRYLQGLSGFWLCIVLVRLLRDWQVINDISRTPVCSKGLQTLDCHSDLIQHLALGTGSLCWAGTLCRAVFSTTHWNPALQHAVLCTAASCHCSPGSGSAKCSLDSGHMAMPALVFMMGKECSSKYSSWIGN